MELTQEMKRELFKQILKQQISDYRHMDGEVGEMAWFNIGLYTKSNFDSFIEGFKEGENNNGTFPQS